MTSSRYNEWWKKRFIQHVNSVLRLARSTEHIQIAVLSAQSLVQFWNIPAIITIILEAVVTEKKRSQNSISNPNVIVYDEMFGPRCLEQCKTTWQLQSSVWCEKTYSTTHRCVSKDQRRDHKVWSPLVIDTSLTPVLSGVMGSYKNLCSLSGCLFYLPSFWVCVCVHRLAFQMPSLQLVLAEQSEIRRDMAGDFFSHPCTSVQSGVVICLGCTACISIQDICAICSGLKLKKFEGNISDTFMISSQLIVSLTLEFLKTVELLAERLEGTQLLSLLWPVLGITIPRCRTAEKIPHLLLSVFPLR